MLSVVNNLAALAVIAGTSVAALSVPGGVGVGTGPNLPPMPADKSTPYHERLALQQDAGSMALGWNTYEKQAQSCVSYGLSRTKLDQTRCNTNAKIYDGSRMWFNTVIMDKLAPGRVYYYKIKSTNSTVQQFQASRSPGNTTPITFNTVIDLGVYGEDGYTISDDSQKSLIPRVLPSNNHTTIARLINTFDDYDFIVHPGDLGYADDWFLKADNLVNGTQAYLSIIEQFYDQLAPVSGRKPYMVTPGNHEAACREVAYTPGACAPGTDNMTDFRWRFSDVMPKGSDSRSQNATATQLRNKAKALSIPPFWWSVDVGMIHLVQLTTETDFKDAPDQAGGSQMLSAGPFGYLGQQEEWLKADLASVDRRITPWVVVAGHRPWYTSTGRECKPCQAAFEKIFYQYGVDLAVFGHNHCSERMLPVYNNVTDPAGLNNPKAPVYIVSGYSGNIEGNTAVGKNNYDYVAWGNDKDMGYGQIAVKDRNNMEIRFIRSVDGGIMDRSSLYKKHDVNFVNQQV